VGHDHGALFGDYHLTAGLTETIAAAHGGTLASDYDGDTRTEPIDIGATS